MNAEFLHGIADLVRALAWPVVACMAMWKFKPELRSLLSRLRKTAGTEFDPILQINPSESLSTEAILSSIPFPRTDAVIAMEQNIQNHHVIAAIKEPARREQAFFIRGLVGQRDQLTL